MKAKLRCYFMQVKGTKFDGFVTGFNRGQARIRFATSLAETTGWKIGWILSNLSYRSAGFCPNKSCADCWKYLEVYGE